jgi:hypothetical protein
MHVVIAQKGKDKFLCRTGSELSVAPQGTGEQVWSMDDGVLKNGEYFLIVDDPFENSQVTLVHHSKTPGVNLWKQDDQGLIYTLVADDSKRYLWILSKVVYITSDATMATPFDIVSSEPLHHHHEPQWGWWIILVALLLGVGLFLMLKR